MTTNIKAIAELSEKLTQVINQLHITNSIAVLDKELLKKYCVELYEQITHLTPNSETSSQADSFTLESVVELKTAEIEQPPLHQELFFTSTVEAHENSTAQSITTNTVETKTETELLNESIDEIVEQQQEIEALSNPVVLVKEIVNELSLHEKIANSLSQKSDLSERLAHSSIPSLKSAIHVNLKIAIVNDLFKENTVDYVKAIDKLNASENIHEAMRYFTELKHSYDWQTDNSLVKELETLINKRFS